MILAKMNNTSWIEQITEQWLVIHFGQITIRMSMEDFYIVASMFHIAAGEEMPDEEVCSIIVLSDGNYIVAYRSFAMTMCEIVLSRFANLCLMGVEQLEIKTCKKQQNHNNNRWGHLSLVSSSGKIIL